MKRIICLLLSALIFSISALGAQREYETAATCHDMRYCTEKDGLIAVRDQSFRERSTHMLALYNADGEYLWEREIPAPPDIFNNNRYSQRKSYIYFCESGIVIPTATDEVICISFEGKELWNVQGVLKNTALRRICEDGKGGIYAAYTSSHIDAKSPVYESLLYIVHISADGKAVLQSTTELGSFWDGLWIGTFDMCGEDIIITGSLDYDTPFILKLYADGMPTIRYPDNGYDYFFDSLNRRLFACYYDESNHFIVYNESLEVEYVHSGENYLDRIIPLENGLYCALENRNERPSPEYHGVIYSADNNEITSLPLQGKLLRITKNEDGYTFFGELNSATVIEEFNHNFEPLSLEKFESSPEQCIFLSSKDRLLQYKDIPRKSKAKHLTKNPLMYVHDEVFPMQ